MSGLEVREVEPAADWDGVVQADAGLVFASAGYLGLLADHLPGVEAAHLGAYDGDSLVAVMPALEREVAGLGRVANSSPFYGSHGGVYAVQEGAEREDVVRLLIRRFTEQCRERGCVLSTVVEPLANCDSAVYDDELRPWRTDGRIGQVVEDLPVDEGELLGRYHQKTRNAVRKARKDGVTPRRSHSEEDLRFLYDVHVENMRAVGGQAKSWAFFEALTRRLGDDSWEIVVGELAGEPVAALLTLAFGDCVEYYTPATRLAHRGSQPMSLLVHDAILSAARDGRRRFNFGGTWSSQHGVFRFKSRFGARERPYRYFVQRYLETAPLFELSLADAISRFEGFYLYPASGGL